MNHQPKDECKEVLNHMKVRIVFCYAHEDELFLDELKSHLKPLLQQDLIEIWYDRDIPAGRVREQEIVKQLNRAHIILLLLSADFMNSEFCSRHELTNILERYTKGEVQLIPIIIRPVLWKNGPFGQLQALPTDGKPITSNYWSNHDEAFLSVVEGIDKIVRDCSLKLKEPTEATDPPTNVLSPVSQKERIHSPDGNSFKKNVSKKMSLSHTFFGHALSVSSIVMTPDERTLVSGGGDGKVKLWNLTSNKLVYTFELHKGGVSSVAISANGQTIASGGRDGTIKIWDTYSKKLRRVFDHSEECGCISMSADGRIVISGGDDGQIKLWNLATGRLIRTLEPQNGSVSTISISADRQMIASGDDDGRIKLWSLDSGKLIRAPKGHTHRVYAIVMNPNGQMLASCGDDETVKLWDMMSGKLINIVEKATDTIYCIAMSQNGQMIASGTQEETVRLRDVPTGNLLSTIEGLATIVSIAMSFNGQRIIIGDSNGTIQIWDKDNKD